MLYTLLDDDLRECLAEGCRKLGLPCCSFSGRCCSCSSPISAAPRPKPRVGAQHMLNAEYFKRIDALNYTMFHDDGQHTEDLEEADVVLVGISRTSKTPTSIYLANRGIKTANVPLVPNIPLPPQLETLKHPLVVGLYATPERIVQIRQNRLLALKAHKTPTPISTARRWRGDRLSREAVRQTSLGIDRRDAPLDRGDRGRRAAISGRTPAAAGGVIMPLWLAVRSARAGVEKRGAPRGTRSGGLAGRGRAGRYRRARNEAKAPAQRAGGGRHAARARKGASRAAKMPGRLVLGADQTLSLGSERFSKPAGPRRCARAAS